MPERSRRRRAHRLRPLALAVGGAAVLSLAGGGVALALAGRDADHYTTATVSRGSVQQTVSAVGTVASASRRDVAFPVAGTVASVAVSLGDAVTAGQVLASLDPTSLQDALDQANDALAQAQQQLSDDLDSQTSTTDDTTTDDATTGGATTDSPTAPPDADGSGGSASPEVTAATQAVTAAQQALLARYDEARAALGVSSQALAGAQAACVDLTSLDPGTVVPDPTDDPTDEPTPTPTPTEEPTDEPTDEAASDPAADPASSDPAGGTPIGDVQELIQDCQDALSDASEAQTATSDAQQAVSDAADQLDRAVAALQDALRGDASGEPSDRPSSDASADPTPTPTAQPTAEPTADAAREQAAAGPSATGSSGTAHVASAADILADRAAIDAAQAQVDIAAHQRALVDLTSPIAGTVAAVSIAAGDQVGASSTSAVITVLGGDGHVVELTVPLASIGAVAVGQEATITVPSSAEPLTGSVASIGVLDVSETSTPEYTVVIAVDPATAPLFDGAAAQVSIAVAATGEVLTVPTAAVHVDGQAVTVQLLEDGVVTDVTVERGAVGAELTEIVSGLTEGQTVVLADRSEPIDTGTSGGSTGLSGLTSGGGTVTRSFGGGTFTGGGPSVSRG